MISTYFTPLAVPFLQPIQRTRPTDILWACSWPQHCFWKRLTSLQNCYLMVWFFFPWLSKRTKVSLRQMANISPFLTSVKTSKSTLMTFHTAFFYVPLKGHRILMSLASMIFICHVLLPLYNKLTKGKGGNK